MEVRAEVSEQKLPLRAALFPCLSAVWNRIIEPVAAMRKEADMLRLFPEYLKGEELFGLTVHAVLRIAESVRKGPGVGAGGRGEGWFCPRSARAKVSMTCARSCLEWKAVKIIYSAMDATP